MLKRRAVFFSFVFAFAISGLSASEEVQEFSSNSQLLKKLNQYDELLIKIVRNQIALENEIRDLKSGSVNKNNKQIDSKKTGKYDEEFKRFLRESKR